MEGIRQIDCWRKFLRDGIFRRQRTSRTKSTRIKLIELAEEQIIVLNKIDELTEGVVKALTLEEVGQLFDVTRERIRQIEYKAMKKLKDKAKRDLEHLKNEEM